MTGPSPERAWLSTLRGAYPLDDLYAQAERLGLLGRDGGDEVIHTGGDTRGKRRLRGGLQTAKRQGFGWPLGERLWFLDGTPETPRLVIMVSLAGPSAQVELRLERAADLLATLDGEADIVFTDPPWACGVGTGTKTDTGHRTYGRGDQRNDLLVPGYQDVDPDDYPGFTKEWITSAADALRPGGYLVVVTGPQQAARVQISAEDAGLAFVNSIAIGKHFPLWTIRKFAAAHWRATVMCRGSADSPLRVFTPPDDQRSARSGGLYPKDFWPASYVGRADARRGQARYPTSLPVRLVDRMLDAYTRPVTPDHADLVVDPFNGGGTIATRAALRGLRVLAGDVNRHSLSFTAHRIDQALSGALN